MKTVLIWITDGFADWEAAYVSPELNKPGSGYHTRTIAVDREPKRSMGGLSVLPDYVLDEAGDLLADTAMLIIPGGMGWSSEINQQGAGLVRQCAERQIPVAAICDATTFLGRHGFLDDVGHTGNTLELLKQGAPNYRGEAHYRTAQAVRDGGWITANGSAAVEFAREILGLLGVYEGEELEEWYGIFKRGYLTE